MILKVGEWYTNKVITATGFEEHCEFRKRATSYTSLIHTIEAYLLTITELFSVMSTFEIFHHQKFGMEKYVIPSFGVSMAILNPVGIFCRWCYFGLLQGQVKSCHFFERIEAKRKCFYFLYIFFGIIGLKRN